jgi:hypothetical protein
MVLTSVRKRSTPSIAASSGQALERHPAAVLQVLREVDPRHPSLPKLALEAVLAGQGGGNLSKASTVAGSMHGGVERDCVKPIVHAM